MEFLAEINKVSGDNDISVFDPLLTEAAVSQIRNGSPLEHLNYPFLKESLAAIQIFGDLGYNRTPLPQASSGGTSSKFTEQVHSKPIISSQNPISSPSIFLRTTFPPPQHPTVTSNLSQSSILPTSPAFAPKIIVNASNTKLSFDLDNVDFFFQRFEYLHRHNNLSSAELFDQLLQCLNYQQQCRMHHLLTNGVGYYFQFKNALIKTFGRTLEQVQEELSFASGLRNKMPSEWLAHLCQILGRHLKENPLLEHILKREFLTRLPTYARDPLILIGNADLDKMAEQADALVADRKRRNFRSQTQHFRFSTSNFASDNSDDHSSHDVPVMTEMLKLLSNINDKLNLNGNNYTSGRPPNSSLMFINPQPFPSRSNARRFGNHQLSSQPPNRHVPSMSRPPHHPTPQRRAPPSTNQNHICWYHQNYGPGARICMPECTFFSTWNSNFASTSGPLNYKGDAQNRP